MKMTLHIDQDLEKGVMKITGARAETDAIHVAWQEMTRRRRLRSMLAEDDLGLDAKGWSSAFDAKFARSALRAGLSLARVSTASHD